MIERVDIHSTNRNPVYLKFVDEHIERYKLAAEIIQKINLKPIVLDCACGDGYGYEYLKDIANYVGLDIDVDTIKRCRSYYGTQSSFLVADLNNRQHLCELFPDVIVSFETAEHLANPMVFFQNVHAALPDDGLFIFSAPTSLTCDFDPYHVKDRGMEQWSWLLTLAGFRITDIRSMPFTMPFHQFLFTVPTTLTQKWSIVKYILTHPRYLADRLTNWCFRNRFYWCTTMFVCEKCHE